MIDDNDKRSLAARPSIFRYERQAAKKNPPFSKSFYFGLVVFLPVGT